MSNHCNWRFSRRKFLGFGLATATDLTVNGWNRCRNLQPLPNSPYEGVYTDRDTYRQGEPIVIHASVTTPQSVEFKLSRYDTPSVTLVNTLTANVPHQGEVDEPGVIGAGFAAVATIDSTALAPGFYCIHMDEEAMEPGNWLNSFNNFNSDNRLARFVVTPQVAGSLSRILWLHDSLLGVCYSSFGGQSIYGPNHIRRWTVSMARPGRTAESDNFDFLRFLRSEGHEFEFIDYARLDAESSDFTDAYDVIINVGSSEYVTHGIMVHLQRHLANGGSLLIAGTEFGAHRVRLDHQARQLTTYKFLAPLYDPLYGSGDPTVAGVGMHVPGTIQETAITGLTQWACNRATVGTWVDLPVYNYDLAGWLLDDTGIGPGGALPAAMRNFAVGNRIMFDGRGEPSIVPSDMTVNPRNTVVWAAFPSPDGRMWWNTPPNTGSGSWPYITDGYALATLEERPEGGRVIGLPSAWLLRSKFNDPVYQALARNLINGLLPDRGRASRKLNRIVS